VKTNEKDANIGERSVSDDMKRKRATVQNLTLSILLYSPFVSRSFCFSFRGPIGGVLSLCACLRMLPRTSTIAAKLKSEKDSETLKT